MDHPSDDLTPAERERLAPHFTDLDGPVFALVNLPETVKGALFARYSRYPGTLRRLFLDEFADSLPATGASYDNEEGRRAPRPPALLAAARGPRRSPHRRPALLLALDVASACSASAQQLIDPEPDAGPARPAERFPRGADPAASRRRAPR